MPEISNVLICDLPIRFDTYIGCSHGCEYCFVKLKNDISKIRNGEGSKSLLSFINKRRSGGIVKKIIDYDIPLHWGGLSDPFQPAEVDRQISYECLKVFRETQYPFVISTKSNLIATPKYLDILKDCNCAVQFSAVGSSYDVWEDGASTFLERVESMKKISALGKRVIVRAQPLLPKVEKEFTNNLDLFVDAGVYGVIIEFMKYKYKAKNTIKVRGDNVYPLNMVSDVFFRIKKEANNKGLKVFAGENRLRQYGDDLCCCGVGDLWPTHKANLNHLLFDKNEINISNCLRDKNIDSPAFAQSSKMHELYKNLSYVEVLNMAMKSKSSLSDFTIDKKAHDKIKNFKPF